MGYVTSSTLLLARQPPILRLGRQAWIGCPNLGPESTLKMLIAILFFLLHFRIGGISVSRDNYVEESCIEGITLKKVSFEASGLQTLILEIENNFLGHGAIGIEYLFHEELAEDSDNGQWI